MGRVLKYLIVICWQIVIFGVSIHIFQDIIIHYLNKIFALEHIPFIIIIIKTDFFT